jgi:hypothetical protein
MVKSLCAAVASGVLAVTLATMPAPAQAGPILDAMKKKAHSARGIAVEGSVVLKHKLKQNAKKAGGIVREGSLIVKCKARDALKLKKC